MAFSLSYSQSPDRRSLFKSQLIINLSVELILSPYLGALFTCRSRQSFLAQRSLRCKKKKQTQCSFRSGAKQGEGGLCTLKYFFEFPPPPPPAHGLSGKPPAVSHRRKMDPCISMVCYKHILEQALYIQVCDRLDFQFRTLMAISDIGNGRTFCAHTFIPGFPSRP